MGPKSEKKKKNAIFQRSNPRAQNWFCSESIYSLEEAVTKPKSGLGDFSGRREQIPGTTHPGESVYIFFQLNLGAKHYAHPWLL